MAIGDTPNQNLFGTNYNAEEEERKKAELAAQNARMGAGETLYRGATGIQDIAGMQGVPQGGTLDPTQGARDLLIGRQFNRGGPVRISDMGSLIQEPQNVPDLDSNIVAQVPGIQNIRNPGAFDPTNIEPVEQVGPPTTVGESISQTYNESVLADLINRGFGQEAFQSQTLDGTPTYSIYNKRFGTLGSQVPYSEASPEAKAQAMKFMLGTGGQERPLPETPTSPVRTPEQVQSILDEQRATQAASALGATPSVTPTVKTPSGGAQGQAGAVQSPFLQSPDTPSGLGGPLLRGFNMVNDASRPPSAPMGQEATRAALGGRTLNEYLTAPAGTEGVSGLQTDPQGRMIPSGFETRADAFPDYEDQATAREARLEARPDFGEAVSDRDRRAARGDGISMADQVDMAKANARGATPREIARGNQVANALGVDLKTGQPLQATGGLTFDQIMKLEEFDFKRGQEAYKRSQDDLIAQGKKTEAFEQDSALLRQVSGDAGRIGRLTNEAIGLTTEPGTTALSGSLLKLLPGSNANQLEAVLEVLQSKVALDRLMEVKKTGATLGQVSEKELAMLQNSYDALKQGLKPERLREALTNYANQLKKVEDQTQRAFIDKHGQEKFNKIMGGGSTGQGEPRYANDQDVGDSVDTYYNPSK